MGGRSGMGSCCQSRARQLSCWLTNRLFLFSALQSQRAGAYRCILTHFSQRYPKWPEGLPAAGDGGGVGVAVAFDGMRVPLALLPALPSLMPAVQAALEEVEDGAGTVEGDGATPAIDNSPESGSAATAAAGGQRPP